MRVQVGKAILRSALELLRPRTNVNLVRPGATRLPMQLQIELSDRIRCQQGILAALLEKMLTLGLDLPVNDHESDVYALWS